MCAATPPGGCLVRRAHDPYAHASARTFACPGARISKRARPTCAQTRARARACIQRAPRARQNFGCTIIESEFISELTTADGGPTELSAALDAANLLFTAVFTAELAVNAAANWFRPFVSDVWSQVPRRCARVRVVCAC